jgi:hypothetical protein
MLLRVVIAIGELMAINGCQKVFIQKVFETSAPGLSYLFHIGELLIRHDTATKNDK